MIGLTAPAISTEGLNKVPFGLYMYIEDPATSVPAVKVIRIPLFPEIVDNCAEVGAVVHVLPTIVTSQRDSETYSLTAWAVAVMVSLAARGGEILVKLHVPELTVVVPISELFLYTRIVVPFPSVEVPVILVAPELIGALIWGHRDRSVQFCVFGEQNP